MAKAAKRARGERAWTDEQKQQHSDYMKELHRQRREAAQIATLPDKTSGIEVLTLGQLHDMLGQLIDSGVKKRTRVKFLPSCCERPEILSQRVREEGEFVEWVIIR